MKLFSILFLTSFATLQAHAQANTPFDFLEASRKANEADRALQKLNSTFGKLAPAPHCDKVSSVNGETVMSCALKPEDYSTPIVKIDYDVDKIPTLIKEQLPDTFLKDVFGKKVSCVYRFKMQNDNQQMLGRKAEQGLQNNKYGDDFGRTHGVDVGVSCASADGLSTAFTYSTDLYSNPDRKSAYRMDSGNVHMKQKFTSENIFALVQDNINQGNATYWKRGVGFINLSDKKKWGLLQSTGQQQWFHDVVNSVNRGTAYEYEYVNGEKDKWGGFVTLAIGLQENRKLGDRCQLALSADVGGRLSTLSGTSSFNANAYAKLSYQLTGNGSIYLRAQSAYTYQNGSSVTENTLAAGYERRSGSYVEMGVTAQKGRRSNVPDLPNFYTGKNDLQIFATIGYKF